MIYTPKWKEELGLLPLWLNGLIRRIFKKTLGLDCTTNIPAAFLIYKTPLLCQAFKDRFQLRIMEIMRREVIPCGTNKTE
jgi:hypothetical protein